jgi:hypothetical protein
MSQVSFRLTELERDPRSREAAFLFEVENHGETQLDLLTVTPVINERLRVQEEYKLETAEEQRAIDEQCERFRILLVEYSAPMLKALPEPINGAQDNWLHRIAAGVADDLATLAMIPLQFLSQSFRTSHAILAPRQSSEPLSREQRFADGRLPEFDSLETTVSVGARVLEEFKQEDSPLWKLCQVHLERLREVARQHEGKTYPVASIAPDRTFSRPFVIEGQRRAIRSRNYVITVEASYAIPGAGPSVETNSSPTPTTRHGNAYAMFAISPNPAMVTLFAVLGAAAGLTVNGSGLNWVVAGAPTLALAAVLFNIIDFTVIGPRFVRHLDWRGALLIGVLCGIGAIHLAEQLSPFGVQSQGRVGSSKSSASPLAPTVPPTPSVSPGVSPSPASTAVGG